MGIKLPFKLTKERIAFILSLILNLLGGTGTIDPPLRLGAGSAVAD